MLKSVEILQRLYLPQVVSLSLIRNHKTYATEIGHANLGKKQPCFPLKKLHGSRVMF